MSEKIFNKPNYKVPVVTPANYAAAETAGTIEEGLLYNITGESPDVIQGTTAPTSATPGKGGDIYLALINGVWRVWDCIAVNGTATAWRERLRADGTKGVSAGDDGNLQVVSATNAEIEAGVDNHKPIVPANLQHAVDTGIKGSDLNQQFHFTFVDGSSATYKLPVTEVS